MVVARMSEATSGNDLNADPGYRFAHPGYGLRAFDPYATSSIVTLSG